MLFDTSTKGAELEPRPYRRDKCPSQTVRPRDTGAANAPLKEKGFTLIELMITIAILAILMGIAYPAYTGYVERSRRADAISGLLQASQQMERCFTRSNTYTGCTIASTSPDGHYSITVTSTATTYSLAAAPTGAQTGDACGTFTLDQLGIKGADGSASDRCWGS